MPPQPQPRQQQQPQSELQQSQGAAAVAALPSAPVNMPAAPATAGRAAQQPPPVTTGGGADRSAAAVNGRSRQLYGSQSRATGQPRRGEQAAEAPPRGMDSLRADAVASRTFGGHMLTHGRAADGPAPLVHGAGQPAAVAAGAAGAAQHVPQQAGARLLPQPFQEQLL